MKTLVRTFFVIFILLLSSSKGIAFGTSNELEVEKIKQQILTIATSFSGQGDPDQSKQGLLVPLVQSLLMLRPMPAVKNRINLLAGPWKQIWGPYDYRNEKGGVDPQLITEEIYQVIFAEGFYYNVAPYRSSRGKDFQEIGLLRGEFQLDPSDLNGLLVKFTDFPGAKQRLPNKQLWELPYLAESGQLSNRITFAPSWIVKIFFGGGKLEEVYTDKDLRLLYGSTKRPGARRSLYVMKRAGTQL